jgi:DNA-binding GntR family transcriptional regulator
MHLRRDRVTGVIGPEYQRLKHQIRARIISGEYPLGKPIPSTARLAAETGMSVPVVRRAVDQLKADGILEGHPGKGVFVRAMPADADSERMSVEALSRQVAELREMAERDGLDEIRAAVGRLEANLIELYGKLGLDYPDGSSDIPRKAAAGRGRAGR